MDASHRQSLLFTLAYYQALQWPLTAIEVFEHLVAIGLQGRAPSLTQCVQGLDALVAEGIISGHAGLYWYGRFDRDPIMDRMSREALNADVWPSVLRSAYWMQIVPFVRMIAASGSLAMGSTTSRSDWDVFIIAEHGRLYTTRAGVLLVAWLQGKLRTKRMRRAPQRFCCNHFITTKSLSMSHRGVFVAHVISWMIPMYDPFQYRYRFRDANRWMERFVTGSITTHTTRREVRQSMWLSSLRSLAEWTLRSWIGDGVEVVLRWWMQRRIFRDPETHKRGGRIIANDLELEFHPRSFERIALSQFNASISALGFSGLQQRDSGLRSNS